MATILPARPIEKSRMGEKMFQSIEAAQAAERQKALALLLEGQREQAQKDNLIMQHGWLEDANNASMAHDLALQKLRGTQNLNLAKENAALTNDIDIKRAYLALQIERDAKKLKEKDEAKDFSFMKAGMEGGSPIEGASPGKMEEQSPQTTDSTLAVNNPEPDNAYANFLMNGSEFYKDKAIKLGYRIDPKSGKMVHKSKVLNDLAIEKLDSELASFKRIETNAIAMDNRKKDSIAAMSANEKTMFSYFVFNKGENKLSESESKKLKELYKPGTNSYRIFQSAYGHSYDPNDGKLIDNKKARRAFFTKAITGSTKVVTELGKYEETSSQVIQEQADPAVDQAEWIFEGIIRKSIAEDNVLMGLRAKEGAVAAINVYKETLKDPASSKLVTFMKSSFSPDAAGIVNYNPAEYEPTKMAVEMVNWAAALAAGKTYDETPEHIKQAIEEVANIIGADPTTTEWSAPAMLPLPSMLTPDEQIALYRDTQQNIISLLTESGNDTNMSSDMFSLNSDYDSDAGFDNNQGLMPSKELVEMLASKITGMANVGNAAIKEVTTDAKGIKNSFGEQIVAPIKNTTFESVKQRTGNYWAAVRNKVREKLGIVEQKKFNLPGITNPTLSGNKSSDDQKNIKSAELNPTVVGMKLPSETYFGTAPISGVSDKRERYLRTALTQVIQAYTQDSNLPGTWVEPDKLRGMIFDYFGHLDPYTIESEYMPLIERYRSFYNTQTGGKN